VAPEECVAFEDSRAGVLSAKAAGMRVVALQRPGAPRQDLAEADEVLTDLGDFRFE
jgi:beta-phosphoglucomutase-like phosphatase (HAD superfamily)